jgi:hypothetical protein
MIMHGEAAPIELSVTMIWIFNILLRLYRNRGIVLSLRR